MQVLAKIKVSAEFPRRVYAPLNDRIRRELSSVCLPNKGGVYSYNLMESLQYTPVGIGELSSM